MSIKAIETKYKGYRFRSRLEARWAVFFDALGLDWVYEPEGFNLGEAGFYLPDFWIDYGTDDRFWVEVKAHKNLSDREYAIGVALSEYAPGFIALGQPETPTFYGPISPNLGEVKVDMYRGSWFLSFAKLVSGKNDSSLAVQYAHMQRLFCWHERMVGGEGSGSFVLWPVPACEPNLCSDPDGFLLRMKEGWFMAEELAQTNPILAGRKSINSTTLLFAYEAARSARFEYGETP